MLLKPDADDEVDDSINYISEELTSLEKEDVLVKNKREDLTPRRDADNGRVQIRRLGDDAWAKGGAGEDLGVMFDC
jgi:hypothetical protein